MENNFDPHIQFAFNSVSFIMLSFSGVLWIKNAIQPNFYADGPEHRLISAILGILLIVFSIYFVYHIWTKLLGILIAVFIVYLFITSNENSGK